MKDYELTVLIHPDLEMNPDPALDKVRKTIAQAGGTITKEEDDGKKRLSYKIGKQEFALYYYFDLSLPSDAPSKISSNLNIADEVLRHLLVRVDERKAKYAKQRAEAEAKSSAKGEDKSNNDNNTNSKEDN